MLPGRSPMRALLPHAPRGLPRGRALFLCHSAKPSGAELALLNLTRHMEPGSAAVLFAEDGPLLAAFEQASVPAWVLTGVGRGRLAARRVGPWLALRGVIDLLRYGRRVSRWVQDRDVDVDVVVARSVKSLLYGAFAARHMHVPLVWSVHDRIAADYLGRFSALAVRCVGRGLASAYIVNSRSTEATIWAGRKPVLVAPPALDPVAFPAFSPTRSECSPIRSVVMAGRISPWKGQDVFLEAFGRVFADTEVEAFVVGGALFGEYEYETQLHRLAADSPCAGRIHFTGHVDNVREYLDAADVLVHASVVPEPFGLVVSEGMAAGCAVVATTPGGPAEVISDGIDGLLVPCGDVNALAAALERLVSDADLVAALQEAGPVSISRYDVHVQAASMQAWLRAISRHTGVARTTSAWPERRPPSEIH